MCYTLTIVVADFVLERGHLLCEMTDGTFYDFDCYAYPKNDRELALFNRQWKYLTKAQVQARCVEINQLHRLAANSALHMSKVLRFGHDHASRGY